MMSEANEPDRADLVVANLREEIAQQHTMPALEEPKEGQEIRSRRPSRQLILSLAMTGVLLLAIAVYVVRVQQAETTVTVSHQETLFEYGGDWLTPGPPPALEMELPGLPGQPELAPPPPNIQSPPPVDMSSPRP